MVEAWIREIKGGVNLTCAESGELRVLAEKDEIKTKSGIPVYHTKIKSRSAAFTKNVYNLDKEIRGKVKEAMKSLQASDFIFLDRVIGQNPDNKFGVRLYIPKNYARLAYMFAENFFPPGGIEPEIVTVCVPDWNGREILVFPNEKVTYILGSDYYGEVKMSFLRMAMHIMREERNGLGLHAGSKVYRIKMGGELEDKGVLIFGLSGTGKTTITCADHSLKEPERVFILQDDINMLTYSSLSYGTEKNFYIKTDSVTSQPALLDAVLSEGAIAENVFVRDDGTIDFDNLSISTNGRCIVQREKVKYTTDNIDLRKVDVVFFNTRRYDIPPVGRFVSPAQAAAFLMLGESTITSADDPNRVGESKRVVAFDPFIIDNHHKNGNIFFDILKLNPHIEVYLLNTGKIGGFDGVKITPNVTFSIVEAIMRGSITWEFNEDIGYDIATSIPGVDISMFNPYSIYGKQKFSEIMGTLRSERREYLSKFSELRSEIREAV
ncbi:MAG: phosphoenolpyruvate carboxykinase [Synergistetes bacterium]|nr:phosphoenolpyruvate carboxykinase [Synergistota bacterium]